MVDFTLLLLRSPNLSPFSNRPPPSSPLSSSSSETSSPPPLTARCAAASIDFIPLCGFSARLLSPSSSSSLSSPSTSRPCCWSIPFKFLPAPFFDDSAHLSRFSSRFSWCHRSRTLSSSAVPAAGGRNPSSRFSISSFVLKQKMRSSLFSEHFMDEAPPSVATDDHDKHLQATLLSTENGGDDHGKLHSPVKEKPLVLSETKVLTLPTILTLGRVASIPILLCVFYSNEWWATTAVACIFVLAAITDWLDGFLARRMGSNSTFGAFLDPVADKLMVATTLVLLSTKPLHISWAASLPWLIPLPSTAIIGREITMSAVREWAASQGENLQAAVAVNNLGKWKTAFQMVALTVLLVTRNGSESSMAYTLVAIGVVLLYMSAALAIWSLFVYMKAIWGALVR